MPEPAVIESTPAPSGSPAPSPSAPASAAPVASPSPSASQQPISEKGFKRALENAAAKQEAATAGQSGTATIAPPTTAAPAGDPSIAKPHGPIPFDVHHTALENARTKAKNEAVAEWRQRYGWAERIPQATIEQWARQSQEISTDPVAHYVNLGRFLQNHPLYGPQMKSHAGRVLAGGGDPMPQPDREIVDERGQVIGKTYADGGLAFHEWSKRQLLSEVQRELNPIKEERARQSADIQARQHAQRIGQQADAVMEELHGILGSPTDAAQANALFEAVHQAQAENPSWSWHKAALHVRKTRVEPSLKGQATTEAMDLMKRKAAGNTANGAGTSSAPAARPKNEKELARYLRENDRAGGR